MVQVEYIFSVIDDEANVVGARSRPWVGDIDYIIDLELPRFITNFEMFTWWFQCAVSHEHIHIAIWESEPYANYHPRAERVLLSMDEWRFDIERQYPWCIDIDE